MKNPNVLKRLLIFVFSFLLLFGFFTLKTPKTVFAQENNNDSSCLDSDGDGIPENLSVDQDGKKYCLGFDLNPNPPIAGQESILTVRGYHEEGIHTLLVYFKEERQEFICVNNPAMQYYCSFSLPIKQNYGGYAYLEIILFKFPNFYAASLIPNINFICPEGSECNPEIVPQEQKIDCQDLNTDGIPDKVWLDKKGKRYCLAININPSPAIVGDNAEIKFTAFYEGGTRKLELNFNGQTFPQNIYDHRFLINSFSQNISQLYPGTSILEGTLYHFSSMDSLLHQEKIEFVCQEGEYCQPEPLINDFINWMRDKGYEKSLSSQYIEWFRQDNGIAANIMRDFLEEREQTGLNQTQVLNFYDVVATDSGATNRSLGQGEGGICEYNENYPEFCPQNNPPPADYLFLQEKFKQIFGVDFQFVYHRLETNYANTFGTPGCWYANDGVPLCQFGSRYNFISQFPEHSIVHYAIQSYKWDNVNAYVYDMTGSSNLVEISFEPYNLYGLVAFSHEYGHTWGLTHPFYYDDQGHLKVVQFDGIMGNTYGVPSTSLLDPLDPMERYALEPENGYLDFPQFVEKYNSVTLGDNWWAPLCDGNHFVNLEVQKSEIIEQEGQLKVKIELLNKGNMPTGYVPVEFINYQDKTVFAKASINYLPVNELVAFYYPLENKDISFQVVIDPKAQVNSQPVIVNFFKNSPPVADAGSDLHAMPGDKVTLSAYRSYDYDDFGIEKYSWRQLEEKSVFKVDLQNADTSSPYFQIPARPGATGWLTFELTVTDQLGLSATDTVGVMVHNISPTADAGQDLFISLPYNEKICLNGSNSSDQDGDIVTYQWEQTEGDLLSFTAEELKQPILCFLAKDKTQDLNYGFKLNVQDNGLLWGSDGLKVYINGYPFAPVGLKSQLLIPAVVTSPFRIYLTWNKNQETDLTGYKIYRKVGQYNSPYTFLSQVNKEEYIDANLKPGYVYSYKIKAVDQAGHESEFSSSVEIKVPLGGKILPKK